MYKLSRMRGYFIAAITVLALALGVFPAAVPPAHAVVDLCSVTDECFTWTLLDATQSGNTVQVRIKVTVDCDRALSHVTFSLPAGKTALSPADGAIYTSPTGRNYEVENPTNNPFYGIKFDFVSGEEIKNGDYDIFVYTLRASDWDPDDPLQVEAKASTTVGKGTLYPALCLGEPVDASIGDLVWKDDDLDGRPGPGETGLAGVQVNLYNKPCAQVGSAELPYATTTTGDDGTYHFRGLNDGAYCVKIAPSNFDPGGPLAGMAYTGDPVLAPEARDVILNPNQAFEDADFGYTDSSISLAKTVSADGNCPGVDTLTIAYSAQVTYCYAITNTGHTYLKDVALYDDKLGDPYGPGAQPIATYGALLAPGATWNYSTTTVISSDTVNVATVVGIPSTGKEPGRELPGDLAIATDTAQVVVIRPGIMIAKMPDSQTVLTGADVTFQIAITNTGDVTLTNVTVSDPLAPACDRSIGTLAAGASTSYSCTVQNVTASFTNTATVTATPPAGPTLTASDSAEVIVLAPARIGDYVWNDANGNGQQDEGAGYGINGVVLRLYRDDGDGVAELDGQDTLVATTTTAGDGAYQFAGLFPGSYWVDVDEASSALNGYTFIAGPQSGPKPRLVTVNAGANYTQADFGYAGRGSVTGVVFYDWDEDGAQGLGETGINGVKVCLYVDSDRDGQLDIPGDPQVACQTTADDGSYAFPGQLPGHYLVVEMQPGDLQSTTPDVLSVVLVVEGASGSSDGNNYGEIYYVRLGDQTWVDTNGNGTPDSGEPGMYGVPLALSGTDVRGQSVSQSTTSVNGSYMFQNLLPGIYTVSAPQEFNGYLCATPAGCSKTVNLAMGTGAREDLSLDFGYVAPTGVMLARFTLDADYGQVLVTWEVIGFAPQGFNVWRADNAKGLQAVLLTPAPVTAAAGSAFRFVDSTAQPGQTYWYWLEDTYDGQRYGPQSASVPAAPVMRVRAFMPLVVRR